MTLDMLWTDYCLLGLLALSTVGIVLSLKRRPVRDALGKLLHRPLAVSAGIVLLTFIAIGVLDSIHFQDKDRGLSGSISLLDKLIAPVGSVYEKTYSAPLALKSFVTETEVKEGVVQQVYPLLAFPAQYIHSEQEKKALIHSILVRSLALSAVFALLLLPLLFFSKRTPALFSACFTFWALFLSMVILYWLSRYFHVLGTGQIGEDTFYYTVKSIRTGLVIGVLTTLFMLPLALFLGIAAGYFGGIIDDMIQYLYTTLSSIPGVLLITASVLSLQTYINNHPDQFTTLAQSADARLLALCCILGVTSWTSLCRMLRAETLKLREIDYVIAARALGSHWFTIIRKHLIPNVMHIVIITLVLDFSFLIMAEALLSYVGVGVSSMTISWGNMINGARMELARDPIIWWPIFAAFSLMFLLVLSINLFADALRDVFDPQHSIKSH